MPPQQSNITSVTERDAAGLRLDLSVALANDTMDGALAAPIATLDDALSEKNAAGRAAGLARSVLSLLARYWRAFQKRLQRQSLRDTLQDLSDRELSDIGLTRGEIDYLTPERAVDAMRDRTMHLWGGRGM